MLVWLLAAALPCAVLTQQQISATGELQVMPSEGPTSADVDFFLRPSSAVGAAVDKQTLWYLAWQGSASQALQTGQLVSVTGTLVGSSLRVSTLQVLSQARAQNFFYGSSSVALTSITFLTSLCGQASVSSVSAFKSMWTMQGAMAAGTNVNNTIEALYRDCSWGKVQFSDQSNIVVDLRSYTPPEYIRDAIPCAGSSLTCSGTLTTLDAGPCASLRNDWMQWAINTTMAVYGIDATPYSRRVLIMPFLSVFLVSGLATIGTGADGTTNAFIQGPFAVASPRAAFHELGHNYGLRHSWSLRNGLLTDYGDVSCAMGSVVINGTSPRCLNAPQAWYAGWAEPVDTLNDTSLPAGTWVTRTIPAYMLTKTNHIRVVPTWVSLSGPNYFFSYRQPVGRDTVLEPWYTSGINVHEYNGTRTSLSGAYPVLQASVITLNSSMLLPMARLVSRFTSRTTTSATLAFCRYSQTTETSCSNGLDDDCNGLTDAEDPACKTMLNRPPSPKPPSPKPPSPKPPSPKLPGNGR